MSLLDEIKLYSHFDGSAGLFLPADLVRDNQMALNTFLAGGSVTATPSGLKTEGKITVVELINTAWRPLPATPLTKRNAIRIQNRSGQLIKLQYVILPDPGFVGVFLEDFGDESKDITESIIIFGRSESSTVNVIVEELA